MGAWRHQCLDDMTPDKVINDLEPSAFMIIGAPDLQKLLQRSEAANDAARSSSTADEAAA
jgi:adenylate kinase